MTTMSPLLGAGAGRTDLGDCVLCPLCHAGYLQVSHGIAKCVHHNFELDLRSFQLSLGDLKQRLASALEVQVLSLNACSTVGQTDLDLCKFCV